MPSHRLSRAKALVLLSVLHFASAQQIGLGPCSTNCFTQGSGKANCNSYTNVSCICMSSTFITFVESCVQQLCPVNEMSASLQYLAKECSDFANEQAGITPVTYTTPGETFTTPAPYTATATATASSTHAAKATTTTADGIAASAKADNSKAFGIGKIIGAICVVVFLVAVAGIIGFVLYRRKRRSQQQHRQSLDLCDDPQRGFKMDEPEYPKYQQGYPPTAPWEQPQLQQQDPFRNVPVQQTPAPYSNPFASTTTMSLNANTGVNTPYSQSGHGHGMEPSPISPYAPPLPSSTTSSYPRDVKYPIPMNMPSPSPVPVPSSNPVPPTAGPTTEHLLNFASQIQLSPAQLAVIERLVAQNLPPQQISAVIEGMMASAASGSSSSAPSSSGGRRVVMNDDEASSVGDPAERKRREAERERSGGLQEEEGTNDPPPMYNAS